MNKNLQVGLVLLAVGIAMLMVSEYTKYIAPIIIGFSLATIKRGLDENDNRKTSKGTG